MKQILLVLAACLSVFVLTGCSEKVDKELSENYIQHLELSKREKSLIQAVTGDGDNPTFIHEFKVDEKWKSVKLWVEKYEYGQLKEKDAVAISVGIEEKGKFVVSFRRLPNGKPNAIVRVALIDDKAIYSSEGNIKLPKTGSSGSANIVSEKVKVGQDMVLAQVIYSKQDQNISIGDWNLYNNPNELAEKTSKYPAVYFVLCSFSEKNM
ncbi:MULTISPECIES: hypothetical protein [unclassified Viridibacillus]|uniref:hypothetical protein n=1 Tax=unclassified Viridibacillus TaxID=2617942 RepID=UPI00096C56D4|nr:hypothetical protein [Viridibacillus sp. FSL H7-0596]OMC86757.1 hypothetical protein BK128_08760 [Viridibacillus sp. FSL H7-0596]